jgi:hypothetical protein
MKLFFNHVVGKVTDLDFYYSPVYAHFETHEEEEAVNSGWLINEWDLSKERKWFQSRVVRLDLSQWCPSDKDLKMVSDSPVRALHMPLVRANNSILKAMREVFAKYVARKGFDVPLNWENMLVCNGPGTDPGHKGLALYYHNDVIIGWVIYRVYAGTLCSLQFAWDYEDPTLELGKLSQFWEMDVCRLRGIRYHNLCSGYEKSSIWKSKLPGFEWWTGTKWSKDKKLYKTLCENETDLRLVHDCVLSEARYDLTA